MNSITLSIPSSFTLPVPELDSLVYAYVLTGLVLCGLETVVARKRDIEIDRGIPTAIGETMLRIFYWPFTTYVLFNLAADAVEEGEQK